MKAILVIDMPDACYECPCYRQTQEGFEDCKATYIPLSPTEVNDIPEWCPLKPMPEKRTIDECEQVYIQRQLEKVYNDGWNACVDELDDELDFFRIWR